MDQDTGIVLFCLGGGGICGVMLLWFVVALIIMRCEEREVADENKHRAS